MTESAPSAHAAEDVFPADLVMALKSVGVERIRTYSAALLPKMTTLPKGKDLEAVLQLHQTDNSLRLLTLAAVATLELSLKARWALSIKKQVAADLGLPTGHVLAGSLSSLTLVRNIAAHHEPLMFRRFHRRIPVAGELGKRLVRSSLSGSSVSSPSSFNYLLMLSYFTHSLGHVEWSEGLVGPLETWPKEYLPMMGCPPDWRERFRWT